MDERQQRQVIDQLISQVAELSATMRAGFMAELQRHDYFRMEMKQRHEENQERLERIEEKQDKTNGNVTRHEAEIQGLSSLWRIVLVLIVTTATITAGIVVWMMQLAK